MPWPAPNLAHLRQLTDNTGILQHARFAVPRYDEGYCLDDNARALLLTTLLEPDNPGLAPLACRYLAFVNHAFNPALGRFRNFMSYARTWLEPQGSDDSHARALWALGATAARCVDPGRRVLAAELFLDGLPAAAQSAHPRSWAYALLGLQARFAAGPGDDRLAALEQELAGRLHRLYLAHADARWPWFEDRLTYCNARLPQALLLAGTRTGRGDWTDCGLRALDWLARIQTDDRGRFAPIGCKGFYSRDGTRAWFDQQPVEACTVVSASLDALAATGEAHWGRRARDAYRWFLGENQLCLPLYDPATGGCRDGLHADRVNRNMGAESTLSYLLAHQAMASLESG
jgi:hypothetical protein